MKSAQLSDNHRRIVTSRLLSIDHSIIKIKQALQSEDSILEPVEERLSEEEVENLLQQMKSVGLMLSKLFDRYNLKTYKKNQRSIIMVQLHRMLGVAEDMYAEKLKGYGTFNPDLEQDYDDDIRQLEKAIKRTFETLNNY